MLKYIFSEVFSILKYYKYELTIIECDAKIQKIYKIKNFNEVNYKVNGRGGTSFTPVIKYINNNNYYKDAILLYFTDGFGEESIPKPNLKIRKMKTRWGVCNIENHNVTLNSELYRYDIECLDYVIVHELSHFIEANHSQDFWLQVSKYCPNYKEIRKKLKD